MRALFALLLFATTAVLPAAGQQIGQNTSSTPSAPYTLSVKSQLVVETVVAKDKQGNFIPGLTAKDFTITEDGVPQTVKFLEHENLPATAAPLPPTTPDDENITIYKRLTRTSIAPEGA